jgi:hypothetical protein
LLLQSLHSFHLCGELVINLLDLAFHNAGQFRSIGRFLVPACAT